MTKKQKLMQKLSNIKALKPNKIVTKKDIGYLVNFALLEYINDKEIEELIKDIKY